MSLKSLFARIDIESLPFPLSRLYSILTRTKVFLEFYERVCAQVLDRVKYGRVLDAGCGPGRLASLIAKSNPLISVTGLDLSGDMVRLAAEKSSKRRLKNIEFKHGDVTCIPAGDESFDLIISTLSFHHWKDPRQALDELYRVLKNGGEAWIYDAPSKVDVKNLSEKYRRYGFFARLLFRAHSLVEPYYSEADVSRMAAASRFRDYRIDHVELVFRLRLFKGT